MFSCIFQHARNIRASALSPHHFLICIIRLKAVANGKSNPTLSFREIKIVLSCYCSKTDSQFKLLSFRPDENYGSNVHEVSTVSMKMIRKHNILPL